MGAPSCLPSLGIRQSSAPCLPPAGTTVSGGRLGWVHLLSLGPPPPQTWAARCLLPSGFVTCLRIRTRPLPRLSPTLRAAAKQPGPPGPQPHPRGGQFSCSGNHHVDSVRLPTFRPSRLSLQGGQGRAVRLPSRLSGSEPGSQAWLGEGWAQGQRLLPAPLYKLPCDTPDSSGGKTCPRSPSDVGRGRASNLLRQREPPGATRKGRQPAPGNQQLPRASWRDPASRHSLFCPRPPPKQWPEPWSPWGCPPPPSLPSAPSLPLHPV